MTEIPLPIIRITTPSRTFEDHKDSVLALAFLPDGRRMVTCSYDKTLRLWDMRDKVVLEKMEGHGGWVRAVAVSGDGQLIASGDTNGELMVWHGGSGDCLMQAVKVHSKQICSIAFSPDGTVLATGSWDKTTELWCTRTWQVQGNPIYCGDEINCIRYSPTGELLAIATDKDIQMWNPYTRERVVNFEAHAAIKLAWNFSLAWTPDGTRLLSAGSTADPTIREWNTSTWQQVGDPWSGHADYISSIAVNSTATLVVTASLDNQVRLWRLSDQRTIAIFKDSDEVYCVNFSTNSKHILSAGANKMIIEWAIPEDALLEDTPKEQDTLPEEQAADKAQDSGCKILAISTAIRSACISGDLTTADELLTQEIDVDGNNYNPYANRSFVAARKSDWDDALQDALRSISIQPSLIGYVSKGIAHCGKMQFQDAMKAFDLAFMFTDGDLQMNQCLLLIKAIALFNANEHDEAVLRIQELAAACPHADTLACCIVEAYLRVQLGIEAFENAHHNEAAGHFSDAININAVFSKSAIHPKFEVFTVIFGWDLKALWKTANQKRCYALLHADRLQEAFKSYRRMMDMSDESTKTSCLDWCTAFKQECRAVYAAKGDLDLVASGDVALTASNFDRSIELYSAVIDLDYATDMIFAKRCKAKLGKMLWGEALLDAQKVIELSPHSYLGYQLKHAAFHGEQRYDEAIEAFQAMLFAVDEADDTEIRNLRRQYISPSDAEGDIRRVIDTQMQDAPPRILNTTTGHLCDREAQINAFKASTEYKELLSFTINHANLRMKRIQDVVAMFFHYVMLSHRWEGKEPLLHDIQDKSVYDLNPVDGSVKLQSFCRAAHDAGYQWAWSDTCCIDKNNNVEVQESVNSMFVWYRHSALTIVYLSDVLPSSVAGGLIKSAWNTRGWTVQEYLAPNVVLFYQKDWTLYLDDRSPNHKESRTIMQELGYATGINTRALVAFRPGMRDAREKLQWASMRVTTLQEDVSYSLFGLFDVHLPVIYGERKQNALGRLLQEIVARSGDISALDWIGKSSQFNSCLPAEIMSYRDPPCTPPSSSENEIQISVSVLRNSVTVDLASELYTLFCNLRAPRFANCRLHLPCITFPVTEVIRQAGHDQGIHLIYEVKTDGLDDLLITTEEKLIQFSRARPTRQEFLLVRPWDRSLLELPDFADNTHGVEDWSRPESPAGYGPVASDAYSRALRLIVRLGQPFSAFLLAQQWGGEYKRIASDHHIIAQVKDFTSIHNLIDVRTLEIL